MRSPLYQKIYDDILDQVKSGKLKAGDKLPSEKELAEEYNVSRITSKKALDLLAQDIVIERIQGRGSFVSNSSYKEKRKDDYRVEANRKSRRKRLIGLIIQDFDDCYGTEIVKTIEEQCAQRQSNLVIKRTNNEIDKEKESLSDLLELGVEGILIYPNHGKYYQHKILELVINNFPLVYIDRYIKEIPISSVGTNNQLAAKDATNYLFSLGHKEIAFISRPADGTTAIDDRKQGFQIAFSEQGIKLKPDYFFNITSYNQFQNTYNSKEIEELLLKYPMVTAFVVSEYTLALYLHYAINMIGKKVPDDYSIICFDSPIVPIGSPFFTHIKQDEQAIGKEAVNLLFTQIEGKPCPKSILTNYKLIEGNSIQSL